MNHSFRDEALLLERGNCAHEVADDDPPEKNEIQQLRLAEPTFRNQRQPLTQVPEQQEDHDQGEHGIAGAEPEPARQIVQPRRYRGGSNPVGDILNDIHKRDQQQDESDGCNFSPAPQPGFIGAGRDAAGEAGHRDRHAHAVQEAIRLLEDAVPVGLPGGFAKEIAQGRGHIFDFHELQKGRRGKAEAAQESGNEHGINHRKQTGPPEENQSAARHAQHACPVIAARRGHAKLDAEPIDHAHDDQEADPPANGQVQNE